MFKALKFEFEVCAESLEACLAARDGGADRIELCSALSEGGLTPSHGLLSKAVRLSQLPVHPILRPRGGDFVYSDSELDLMTIDLLHARELGARGVVVGILTQDGRIDMERTRRLVTMAHPLDVTFHRAFDCVDNLSEALEDVIATGCTRVLTSGGKPTVREGAEMLGKLVTQAGNRIVVMAGGGLRMENAVDVAQRSGASAFHGSPAQEIGFTISGHAGGCGLSLLRRGSRGCASDDRYAAICTRPSCGFKRRWSRVSFYLGVDAGGTKTDFLLADESRVIARVRSGTIKRMRADEVTVTNNLDKALRELTAASGIAMSSVSRTCIGTAGETVPLVTDWLRQAFGLRVSGALTLVGDVEIALDAAFPAKPGIIVLAGTGSNVAGRARDGSLYNAGGWGPALGDQGSGHRIGLQAVRAAFMAIDESPDPREIAQNAPLLRSISEFGT